MTQGNQEATLKELVEKIQQFFSHQIETNNTLDDAAKESLTVATECIEQVYNIQRKPASQDLFDIYRSHQQQSSQRSSQQLPNVGDPAQLVANLASSLFSQVAGNHPATQATSGTPATDTARSNSTPTTSAPPRTRKNVTEAEKLAAESFKNQGNDFMKQEKNKEALDCYTQAINIDDNNAIYYSNRAAAHSKMGDHQAALRDCQKAIEIDPNYSKAYGRMGLAYASMENHLEAKKAYVKAVELDPNNESYRNNLSIAEEKLAEQQGGGGGAAPGANVAAMFRSLMGNPQMMSMAMQGLQDPRIQSMFGLGGSGAGGQQQAASGATAGQTTESTQQQQQQNLNTNSAPQQHQTEASEQRQQTTAGSQASATSQAPQGEQQPAFNPADLLNLTSRIAGNANIDLVGAGQQILSSIQQNNPDLVDNMRRMMSQAFMNPNNPNRNDRDPPPGYS